MKQFDFPSMTISISFLMDVACRCIGKATLENLTDYTGKSKAYVKGALTAAISIGLIVEIPDEQYMATKECASLLTDVPTKELKIQVFRIWLQRFEPFTLFMQYITLGDSTLIASKKMSSFYKLNKAVDSVERILVAWGKGAGLLDNNGKSCISEFKILCSDNVEELRTESNRDIAIRIYLAEALTSEVYAWLEHDENEELVSSIKKYPTDPRGAIECAGRAFEDILRRIAFMRGLDVSKQNGISQVINFLISQSDANVNLHHLVHTKQHKISQAIGDIRNMAGHSKEAQTMERWDISITGAIGFIHITVALIKSLYLYSTHGVYTF